MGIRKASSSNPKKKTTKRRKKTREEKNDAKAARRKKFEAMLADNPDVFKEKRFTDEEAGVFKRACEDLKGISGIYMVTSLITGKKYIGQAVDIRKRWCTEHISFPFAPSAFEGCTQFYAAIRKYGIHNFKFEVIREVEREGVPRKVLDDLLNDLEIQLIAEHDTHKNGMNCTPGGNAPGSFLGKKHTDASRAKMSAAKSGKNNASYGKHPSAVTKAKIGAANKGRKHTEASKAKLSAAISKCQQMRIRGRRIKIGEFWRYFDACVGPGNTLENAKKNGEKGWCTTRHANYIAHGHGKSKNWAFEWA